MTHRRPTRVRVLIAIALLAIPASARAQNPDDIFWSPSFDAPAFDSPIQDFANFGGDLVAAGAFGQTPDGPASAIARWDGKQWRPLGDGVYGGLWALVEFEASLIAGGAFGVPGSDTALNVARWDGVAWHRMGSGLQGQVLDLAVVDDELFAAGDFTFGASFEHVPVARWNGTEWEPVGPLVPSAIFARARKLTIFEGSLVACGRFRREGVTEVGIVLRWTGADWDTLASGDGSSSAVSIAVDGTDLVVGGFFTLSPGHALGPIARWNGTTWTTELSGWDGIPYELKPLSDGLYMAGLLTNVVNRVAVARVSAGVLEPLPVIIGTAYALAEYRNELYAGGSIESAEFATGIQTIFHCVRRGTTYWEDIGGPGRDGYGLMGTGFPAVNAMLPVGDQLYVGGSFSAARSGSQWVPTGAVARWNGSSWTEFSGLTGSVSALAWFGGRLIAGGDFTGPFGINNLAYWDGTDWSELGGGTDGEVMALLVSGSELYVGGRFETAGGVLAPRIARFDGAQWSPVGSVGGLPAVVVRALMSTPGGDLIAAGSFEGLGGVAADNVARWDGIAWSAMGAGFPGEAVALAEFEGDVIAGGYPSGGAASPVLRWTGATWEPLGVVPGLGVRTLCVAGGSLHAGGQTFGPDDVHIARWNGVSWESLGSGIGQRAFDYRAVSALSLFEGSLYVGGAFNQAGGHPSASIARWDGLAIPEPVPQPFAVELGRPNPFAEQTAIEYTPGMDVTIQVHDLNGRKVRTLPAWSGPLGRSIAIWDGRDDENRRVPAGVYYVRFVPRTGDPIARKVVLLP